VAQLAAKGKVESSRAQFWRIFKVDGAQKLANMGKVQIGLLNSDSARKSESQVLPTFLFPDGELRHYER
jgi:hypothetical protein